MRTRCVRLHANWGPDDETREFFNRFTRDGDYRWRDLELTLSDQYDNLIIFNHPQSPVTHPEKAIAFECETAPLRARFKEEFGGWMKDVARVFRTPDHFNFPGWSIRRAYRTLLPHPPKDRLLSAVISGKTWLPRQRARLRFVCGPLTTLPLDHFGHDVSDGLCYRGPVVDKGDALLPYRYTFAAENFIEPNYFTEKIHDGIACECLTFYDGCPNLDRFLHRDAYIPVDVTRPDEAVSVIADAMARDEWKRRLSVIREEKRRLMIELNPLEIIWKAVNGAEVLWP